MAHLDPVDPEEVRFRPRDFPTGFCGNCRYFQRGFCTVLLQEVPADWVCDAWNGTADMPLTYEIPAGKEEAFVRGMVENQPYQQMAKGTLADCGCWIPGNPDSQCDRLFAQASITVA